MSPYDLKFVENNDDQSDKLTKNATENYEFLLFDDEFTSSESSIPSFTPQLLPQRHIPMHQPQIHATQNQHFSSSSCSSSPATLINANPNIDKPHNIVERRYRNNINALMHSLKMSLPSYSGRFQTDIDGPPPKQPPKESKGAILKEAICYIRYLRELSLYYKNRASVNQEISDPGVVGGDLNNVSLLVKDQYNDENREGVNMFSSLFPVLWLVPTSFERKENNNWTETSTLAFWFAIALVITVFRCYINKGRSNSSGENSKSAKTIKKSFYKRSQLTIE